MKFLILLQHDLKVALRNRYDLALLISFTLISTFLFPLAIGSDPHILSRIAVGIIWVVLVFAVQLSVPMIWKQDVEDGTLNQLILSGIPIEQIVLSKAFMLLVICLGSLSVTIPVMAYIFHFNSDVLWIFLLSFLIASFPLTLLGITGASLSLGHPRASLLSVVLMTPLYIPLVIFSSSSVTSVEFGVYHPLYIWILAALALGLSPFLLMINILSLKWATDL